MLTPVKVLTVVCFLGLFFSWRVLPAGAQTSGVPTTTTVVLLNPATILGQPVSITAMIISAEPTAGVPSGTVEFFDGPDSLGTAALVNSNGLGIASLTVDLPAGLYAIHAVYSGDYAFDISASSPSISLLVFE